MWSLLYSKGFVGAEGADEIEVFGSAGCDDFNRIKGGESDGVLSDAAGFCEPCFWVIGMFDVQLPPQTRTVFSWPRDRSTFRHPDENKASHTVVAARVTVAACSGETPFGSLKQIFSSARVYSLYAPRPLISPVLR